MKCERCGKEARIRLRYPPLKLCPDCFNDYFQSKVKKCVEKYKIGKKAGVAVSGGKDSMSLLKFWSENYEAIAIHLNVGVGDFSRRSYEIVKEFCSAHGIDLIYASYADFGISLEKVKRKKCSACGLIRRYLLNKLCREHGIKQLITGHHLNDVCIVLMKNYLHGNLEQVVRIKPQLPTYDGLVAKGKPFFFISEAEILEYATINEVPYLKARCPFKDPKLKKWERILKSILELQPNFMHQLVSTHLRRMLPILEKEIKVELKRCKICGYPTLGEICSFCKLLLRLRKG